MWLAELRKFAVNNTIMPAKQLTPEQVAQYHEDGYLVVPHFFNPEQIGLLYQLATEDNVMASHAFDLNDQSGKKTKLTLWFTPGDDAYGMLVRSESLVNAVHQLLGKGEVCHFHSKLMQKEPRVGGAWEWHQDYGYWYKNGFLYPDALISVMLALTEANRNNGCLQVLKGSHKMGRFEHLFAGEQQGADMPFVEEALKHCERVYVELQPGDVLFFHSNLLHMSEANLSERPRWSLISAYNLSYNVPFREKHTSCITPVTTVPDEAILESGYKGLSNSTDFLKKEDEITLKEA
jgi:Phytanoyl-CoA dioxygenase (PhyH)